MEKHFSRRPLPLLRKVLKGVHPLQILLAVLSTFPLDARSRLKNTYFISMADGSHVCHTIRPAAAWKYLRWSVAICFLLEDFHATQNMSLEKINSTYAKRILEN